MDNDPPTPDISNSNDSASLSFSSVSLYNYFVSPQVTPESFSDLSPDLIRDWPQLMLQNYIFPIRRQPLQERAGAAEVVNYTNIASIRDLENLEEAFRCRLLTRAEFEILRTLRDNLIQQNGQENDEAEDQVVPQIESVEEVAAVNESEENETPKDDAPAEHTIYQPE